VYHERRAASHAAALGDARARRGYRLRPDEHSATNPRLTAPAIARSSAVMLTERRSAARAVKRATRATAVRPAPRRRRARACDATARRDREPCAPSITAGRIPHVGNLSTKADLP
jgi:hypothetical protein